MTRNAKPGETCINCGQVVHLVAAPAGDTNSRFETSIQVPTCGCDTIDGPQVADD